MVLSPINSEKYIITYKNMADTIVNVDSASYKAGYEAGISEPTNLFFYNNTTYYAKGDAMNTVSLTSYSKYKDLVLNKNLFIVVAGKQGFQYKYDRTAGETTPYFSYNNNNGILTYCGGSSANQDYWHFLYFKILIVE